MVGVLYRIYPHFAQLGAGSAAHAFALIHPVFEHRDGVEYGVDGPQRADVLAERPVDDDGQQNGGHEQDIFPGVQPAQNIVHGFVHQHQGDTALQRPYRADQLAEIRCALAHHIHQEHGQQNDENHQDHILQPAQQLVAPKGPEFLWKGELVQQLLDQSERT